MILIKNEYQKLRSNNMYSGSTIAIFSTSACIDSTFKADEDIFNVNVAWEN